MRQRQTGIGLAGIAMALAVTIAAPAAAASSGWLDRTYGTNGTVDLRISGNDHQLNALGLVRSPRGVVVLSNARFENVAAEESTGYRLDGLTSSGGRDVGFNGGSSRRAAYVSFGRASDLAGSPTRLHIVGSGSDVVLGFARVDVYTWNGELDDSFAGDGVAFLELEPSVSALEPHIVTLSDGRVRVCFAGGSNDVYLWGLTESGDPDTSVGPGGLRVLDFGAGLSCEELLADASDRLVLLGRTGPGTFSGAIIGRFSADGEPDMSFGTAGRTELLWPNRRFNALGAVRIGNSGYVIAGQSQDEGSDQPITGYTARFDANGVRDPGYGFGGVYRYPADAIVRGIDVAGNGKLILGTASVVEPTFPPVYRERLLRIDASTGRLDPAFGQNGAVVVFHRANDTVVDGAGRTITAGTRSNSTTSVLVQRRLP